MSAARQDRPENFGRIDMQQQGFRRVSAVHPQWTASLILSEHDNTVVHETHGSRGTYRLADGMLQVAWEAFPVEDFIQVGDVFLHASMAEIARRRQPPRVGAAAGAGTGAAVGTAPAPPIHVVSLQRTPARRERFASLNGGIAYDFFDAVDGGTVDPAAFFGPLAEPGVPFTPGAIGCALSHLRLWEKAISEDAVLTIVEDDAILRHDFAARSREVIDSLPADWHLIMWGWNFDSVLSLIAMPGISPAVVLCDQAVLRQSLATFRSLPLPVQAYRLDKALGTCAYSISPAGARTFRDLCFPIRNQALRFPLLRDPVEPNGIDIAMNRVYPATRSYVAFPPLAVTPNLNGESLTLAVAQPGPVSGADWDEIAQA